MEVRQGGKFARLVTNRKFLNVFTAGTLVAFGLLYIVQVNAAVTKGNTIDMLKQQNVTIKMERERLDGDIARLRSLESVTAREAFLGLSPVLHIRYITPSSGAVAFK